jgi:chemotaxis protein histidine kinase CheA
MSVSQSEMNGTKRPAMAITEDWQAVATDGIATVWEKGAPVIESAPEPVVQPIAPEPAVPAVDYIALAEAEAIRQRAADESEARRMTAEAEARAIATKAEAEAEKLRLANERTEMRLEKERADHAERMAESNRRRQESERITREADEADAARQQTEAEAQKEIDTADQKWRKYAIRFAVVCGIVALPVQVNAFWNPHAPWLAAAPLMLEGGSWVVQRGAAAAVANRRPLWHYRVIAWLLALIAAGINLGHGWTAFDPFTAMATAFASLAGPGVWDLHEHGRIRKRDGALSRRERKDLEKAEEKAAAEKAAAAESARVAKVAADEAAKAAAEELAAAREANFPKVWQHAQKLAFNLGETTVTEAIWKRAHNDIEGCDPGDSVDIRHGRKAAERRLESVATGKPVNTLSKTTNAQRVPHLPPGSGRGSKTGPRVRGKRRPGDATPFVNAARTQAAITAKQSVRSNISDAN